MVEKHMLPFLKGYGDWMMPKEINTLEDYITRMVVTQLKAAPFTAYG